MESSKDLPVQEKVDEKLKSIQLHDNFTLFFYAFRIPNLDVQKLTETSMWKVENMLKPDRNVFFHHVYDFFIKNSEQSQIGVDSNQCVILSIEEKPRPNKRKKERENPDKGYLFRQYFGKHEIKRPKNLMLETKQEISFRMYQGNDMLAPHIFCLPVANLCILSLGVSLTDKVSLHSFIEVNNAMRVIADGRIPLIRSSPNTDERAIATEDKIATLLQNYNGNADQASHTEDYIWSLQTYFNYLLEDFQERIPLSSDRLQAFSFLSLCEKLNDKELKPLLFQISRLYTSKYGPSETILNTAPILYPFKSICQSCYWEGSTVLLNCDEEERKQEFFNNYGSHSVNKRTVWVYLLTLIQSYSLISSATEVSELYERDKEPDINDLALMVNKLSKIQLKCLFKEVSFITHHNQFYKLCKQSLLVPSLFAELKEEIESIIHQLNERQNKRQQANSQNLNVVIAIIGLSVAMSGILASTSTNFGKDLLQLYGGSFLNMMHGSPLLITAFNVLVIVIVGIVSGTLIAGFFIGIWKLLNWVWNRIF